MPWMKIAKPKRMTCGLMWTPASSNACGSNISEGIHRHGFILSVTRKGGIWI